MKKIYSFIAASIVALMAATNVSAQGVYIYKNGFRQTIQAEDMDSLVFFPGLNRPPHEGKDVYVVGYEYNENNRATAKMWINGNENLLSTAENGSYAYAITISGDDVYVGGYEYNDSYKNVATIWKNGVAQSLTDGQNTAEVLCLAVNGSDVYAGGYQYDSSYKSTPTIWKNGEAQELESDGNARVKGIFIDGQDVYAVGLCNKNYQTYPVMWKNGTISYPAGDEVTGTANGIVVANGHTYIIGERIVTRVGSYPFLMTDGDLVELTDNATGSAADISVSPSGDVYVAGMEYVENASQPRLWKNGVAETVPLLEDGVAGSLVAVAVDGSDVYLAGSQQSEGSHGTFLTWRNGVPSPVNDGTHYGIIYGMAIK